MLSQHHSFNMVTAVGGSLMKKYDPTFAIKVERDEWEVHSAAAEAVQLINFTQLQAEWKAIGAARVTGWDAAEVQRWVASVVGDSAQLPSQLTGAQLCRLGRGRLRGLCGAEAGEQL